jgi:hypothetical protein
MCLVLPWRTRLDGLSLTGDSCPISANDLIRLAVISWEIEIKNNALNSIKMEDFLESSIYDLISNSHECSIVIHELSDTSGKSKELVRDSLWYDIFSRVARVKKILTPTLGVVLPNYLLDNNLSVESVKASSMGLILTLVGQPCRL